MTHYGRKRTKQVRGERLESKHCLTSVGFAPHHVDLTALAGPSQVETADFDQDGDLDLLVASWWDSKFSWFEKVDGRGAYVQHLISDDQKTAYAALAADLDGDGDMDVLGTSQGETRLVWFENTDGRGGFGPPQAISEPTLPVGPGFPADIDRDGDLDVVVPEYESQQVTWYENRDGKGSFGNKKYVSNDQTPKGYVTAGDIDRDGDVDVVSSSSGATSWLENLDGLGTFAPGKTIASIGSQIELQDMDGDGDLDLVADRIWFENTDGLGSFRASDLVGYNTGFDVGDLDRDGDLDIADVGAWYKNTDGSGRFSEQRYDVPQEEGPVHVADLDADGDLDLLHATTGYLNTLAWRENRNGSGDFGPRESITGPGKGAVHLVATDVDGDRDLDLIAVDDWRSELGLYLNSGDGQFAPRVVIGKGHFVNAMATDIDGDADVDILASATYAGETVWFQNLDGKGTFSEPMTVAKNLSAQTFDEGDFDRDGDVDFVLARNDEIVWYQNMNGRGDFLPAQRLSVETGLRQGVVVRAVDLDGDGDRDVVFGNDRIGWYENLDGRGTFGSERVVSTDGAHSLVTTDIDGDGDWDLVSANPDEGVVGWYANDGRGQFSARRVIAEQQELVTALFAGDMDRDGDPDMLFATNPARLGAWRGAVYWAENLGEAGFAPPRAVVRDAGRLLYNYGHSSVSAGDLDSDGDLDVISVVPSGVLIAPGEGQITWHENRLVGDINRDGQFDSSDLVAALQAGEYNDRGFKNSTFDEGDWDGDGEFDSSDLIMAFQSGRYRS